MARSFVSATGDFLSTTTPPVTNYPLTMVCWFNAANVTAGHYLLSVGDNTIPGSSNVHSLVLAGDVAGDPVRARSRAGAGIQNADTTAGFSATTWQHAAGVWAASNDRAAFLNGGSKGTNSTSVIPTTPYNLMSVGAPAAGATPTAGCNASIAEAAVWNVALTDAEVAILALGYSPLLVRPESLVWYIPFIRDNDRDLIGGIAMTPAGAPGIAVHTRVFYPGLPNVLSLEAAAAGGGARSYGYIF